MLHPFPVLMPEYAALLASARVTRPAPVRLGVECVMDSLPRYLELSDDTGVPAPFLGALDLRESNCNPRLGLGQGDPWDRVSTHVPRNQGPFRSWLEAGNFYVRYDHLNDTTAAWTWEYECWKGEGWNGFGPRNHGRHTGYLWSCTSCYDPPRLGGEGKAGKYVGDGEWSPDTVDAQPGIIPVMRGIIALRPDLALARALPTVQAPTMVPDAKPTPEGMGQSLGLTVWLQESLNRVLDLHPPIDTEGSYGRETRQAVREFQRLEGLVVDGLAGETQTLPRLRQVLASTGGAVSSTQGAGLSTRPAVSSTMPALNRMRVTARSGLNVRQAPDASAPIVRVLTLGQVVVCGVPGAHWTQVGDVDKPWGWVAAQYLEAVAKA